MLYYLGTSPWTQTNVTDGNHRIAVLATCPDGGKKIRSNFRFKVTSVTN